MNSVNVAFKTFGLGFEDDHHSIRQRSGKMERQSAHVLPVDPLEDFFRQSRYFDLEIFVLDFFATSELPNSCKLAALNRQKIRAVEHFCVEKNPIVNSATFNFQFFLFD